MPPKSIFRQPGARHFQLVHRSQRDPLIHDQDASQHVLKPVARENVKKGKSRADLESLLSATELTQSVSHQAGEAALYGVYLDDTEYDYMQHLRTVGVQEDGVESILIEALFSSGRKPKTSRLQDLPAEVLPSTSELPRTYESQQAIPESIAGFQPDMDPHLRQTLEALEDDAFVDDELDDAFFGELIADGERGSDDEPPFEFHDNGIEEPSDYANEEEQYEAGWEEQFKRFKQAQKMEGLEIYEGSEGGDTLGTLPAMSVIGGKKRRKGTSDATGYSMSSSSMYRNDALQTLDECFDQMVIKEYAEDAKASSDEFSDSDDAPELITSREDFESMMDEFLLGYEILGRKMQQKLDGDTGVEKLETIRRALGRDERIKAAFDEEESPDLLTPVETGDMQDRWDCETILSTYSNLENHPRIIRVHNRQPVTKILLNPKTGLPTSVYPNSETLKHGHSQNDSGSDTDTPRRQTLSRPREESKEDKKARKATVRAERRTRRVEKKATKELFSSEMKAQMRTICNKDLSIKRL